MKYKSCREVESSIHFILDILSFCCNCSDVGDMVYREHYNGEIIDFDDFMKARNKFRQRFLEDTIPPRCRTCASYKEDNWSDDFRLSYICIAHRSKCSCNCFYCNFAQEKNMWNTRKVYNILPAFKGILDTFPLNDFLSVNLVGGECSEYPKEELDGIIDETIKHHGVLNFTTSGMLYNEKIAQALALAQGDISISPDSGTKETYEKIKRVKYYDRVWENIKKYSQASSNLRLEFPVRLKYIIIPDVNDNEDEFRAFAEKCMALKNTMIEISVEYKWFSAHSEEPLTPKMLDFLGFIQSYENQIHIAYKEAAVPLLRKIRNDFYLF